MIVRMWHRLGWFGQIMFASALFAAFELLVLPPLVRAAARVVLAA